MATSLVMSVCLTVCPSVRMEKLDSYSTDFHEICYDYFRCYTVHVVELLNYYTNHCTYIKFYTLKH